jgi:hypothetical protein
LLESSTHLRGRTNGVFFRIFYSSASSLTRPADARGFSSAFCSNRAHIFAGARMASFSESSIHLRHPKLLSL